MNVEEYHRLVALYGAKYVEKRFPYVTRKFFKEHPDLRTANYRDEIVENYNRDKLFKK